ncbi:MAG: DUF6288 domain-containing protein [Verrucomicrobia bacterium]|nr:DUF6288 domain-containing protein [Verrucomicrobiota bacterium]
MKNLCNLRLAFTLSTFMCLLALGDVIPPDLTQGETEGGGVKVDRDRTYNLGPTGMRGWMYGKAASNLDSAQGRSTAASRQILVTHVGVNSPAAGIMEVNDVILGVAGRRFDGDARKAFGRAITEAEKTENNGILKLTRWRGGQTEEVQVKLNVLGTYSDTAPYRCSKSAKILAEACIALEKEPLHNDLWGAVNGLALLATGKADDLPKIQAFARSMAEAETTRQGGGAWDCGYKSVFLSEYYLLTGDKAVLSGIETLTLKMARGQGMYGTFGHGFSELTPDGQLHGRIPPYGPVNQAGLIANIGIVMGKMCGIKNPEVDAAITRGAKFFAYFVDKGTIPYGEHEPYPFHENNGKSALSAILFSLQNKQVDATQFYSKMATAAYANREYGHTGQGFGYLWSALGANVGGPGAGAAFFKEAAWHLDLVRRCDGSFTYDGGEQYGAGKTHDNTYYGRSSYSGLSPDATYVLTYSIPLKKLYITGKKSSRENWLSQGEVARAIASGRFDVDRTTKPPQELVAAFEDWSPVVRGWAAEELARRPEAGAMVSSLMIMAEGKNAHSRQGACEALGYIKDKAALPVLVRLLSHEDRWLRYKAAQAIRNMSGEAKSAVPDILKAIAETAEDLEPISWKDPIQLAHGQLAAALFAGPLTDEVIKADTALLYPAIRVISRNADGMARAKLRGYFERHLTVDDVQALAPDILAAIITPSPADSMFSNEIRMGGFKALSKYHFEEGIQAGVALAETQGGHGSEGRTGEIMQTITSYGSAARVAIPKLEALIVDFNAQCENHKFPSGELNDRRVNSVKEAIAKIEAAQEHPELRRIVK